MSQSDKSKNHSRLNVGALDPYAHYLIVRNECPKALFEGQNPDHKHFEYDASSLSDVERYLKTLIHTGIEQQQFEEIMRDLAAQANIEVISADNGVLIAKMVSPDRFDAFYDAVNEPYFMMCCSHQELIGFQDIGVLNPVKVEDDTYEKRYALVENISGRSSSVTELFNPKATGLSQAAFGTVIDDVCTRHNFHLAARDDTFAIFEVNSEADLNNIRAEFGDFFRLDVMSEWAKNQLVQDHKDNARLPEVEADEGTDIRFLHS